MEPVYKFIRGRLEDSLLAFRCRRDALHEDLAGVVKLLVNLFVTYFEGNYLYEWHQKVPTLSLRTDSLVKFVQSVVRFHGFVLGEKIEILVCPEP